ncbi:protein phosphatase 1 regulatory subunit 15B [Pholidichthys leucotaenia]
MFGNMSSGRRLTDSSGHSVTSTALQVQESSWIDLISVVSRPAMSLLQKLLPDRPRSGDLSSSFIHEKNELLRQLDEFMPRTQNPAPHLPYRQCRHSPPSLLESEDSGSFPWLDQESQQELRIENAGAVGLTICQQTQFGYFSPVRTVVGHVRLNSQGIKAPGGQGWVPTAGSPPPKSRTWWGSFWRGEENSHKKLLTDLPWAKEGMATTELCPQQRAANTKASCGETAPVFVQGGSVRSTLGEKAGPTNHIKETVNNEQSTLEHQISSGKHLSSNLGTAASCSEVAVLTPDQDHGYSSLEEEQSQHRNMGKDMNEELLQQVAEMEEEPESANVDDKQKELQPDTKEVNSSETPVLTTPQCQNKSIAFIMGCPCSDDEGHSSQSEQESSDDDFDSEGMSDLSDSSDDEDDDDSDSEADSESEQLWNSLCQSLDPYNPRNFTAQQNTGRTRPQTIPVSASTPPSSAQSTPASSPEQASPLAASPSISPSSSPPSSGDGWDDSTSASEVDEAETLHLLNSFSCSSDPYSLFNFQAQLRTREPTEVPVRAKIRSKKASYTPSRFPCVNPAPPPVCRMEDEERLDSGFSELSTRQSCRSTKKVRFCDDVEEFFASCEEEDRRGPWEELARDRCRFLRRCQEVEQSIAYCLQPQHRSVVYERFTVLYVQDF